MKRLLMMSSVFGLSTMGLVGCGGSVPPPTDAWAAAQADVGRAESGGAPEVPDARLHLQLAEENLRKAKSLMNDDNSRAASLTDVARVEAKLALSLAKASQAEQQASAARADLAKAKGGQ